MHYQGDCYIIRVSRSCIFIGCCLLFYKSLIFNTILLRLIRAINCAQSPFTVIFSSFLLAVCVILAKTLDCFLITQSQSCNLLLSLISFCLLFNKFLTTKRHYSNVQSSYIPIFNLFLKEVYPVGLTKVLRCFLCKITHNSLNVDRIHSKFNTVIYLQIPNKCTKFQLH